jgi:long-chain acyl-CoA synthetase
MNHPLSQRISDVLALAPDSRAIEYEGEWSSWGQLGDLAHGVEELVVRQGGGAGTQVGVLLRNRPAYVATVLGVLLAGATVVVINPSRGDDRTIADVAALELPIVVGDADDVATLVRPAYGSTVVTIAGLADTPVVTPGAGTAAPGRPGVAVRMLTSGTTGPPKRVRSRSRGAASRS